MKLCHVLKVAKEVVNYFTLTLIDDHSSPEVILALCTFPNLSRNFLNLRGNVTIELYIFSWRINEISMKLSMSNNHKAHSLQLVEHLNEYKNI